MQKNKHNDEIDTLECNKDERDRIKIRLMDIQTSGELNSINLKLEKRRFPLKSITLHQAEERSAIYEAVSKLGVQIMNDYDFFSNLIVQGTSRSPLYDTAMKNLGYQRQGGLWYSKLRPCQDVIIDLIFKYCLYSYICQMKKMNKAKWENNHQRSSSSSSRNDSSRFDFKKSSKNNRNKNDSDDEGMKGYTKTDKRESRKQTKDTRRDHSHQHRSVSTSHRSGSVKFSDRKKKSEYDNSDTDNEFTTKFSSRSASRSASRSRRDGSERRKDEKPVFRRTKSSRPGLVDTNRSEKTVEGDVEQKPTVDVAGTRLTNNSQWRCQSCLTMNSHNCAMCIICERRRGTSGGGWNCQMCTFLNRAEFKNCDICGYTK